MKDKTPKIIAVDFDGTLCTNAYPEIGEPIPYSLCNVACLCPQWKAAGMCCECDVFYSLRDYHAEQLANNKEK